MTNNARYISGEWYESEYAHGWYKTMYIDTPLSKWAVECNRFVVDLMIAYTGLDRTARILDLGSGAGHMIRAWKNRGFINVHGIEISPSAVRASGNPNIKIGTVADMSMFRTDEFDLVCSCALLEHIDASQEHDAIKEIMRVGKRQAHCIGLDKGSDPGHINIKTMDEWADLMGIYTDGMTAIISNPITDEPMLVSIPENMLIHPLKGLKWAAEIEVKGEMTV